MSTSCMPEWIGQNIIVKPELLGELLLNPTSSGLIECGIDNGARATSDNGVISH